MTTKLRIDDELRAFIPALSAEERDALERSLIETGRATNPITVWRGTILDGHHRYELCTLHGLPYDVIDLGASIADRDAAKAWMFDHQIARRNLSRDQIIALAALRGVAMPAGVRSAIATCESAIDMAAHDEGRALLERVLRGERTMPYAANDWARRDAPRRPAQTRRTRVQIALDGVREMNAKDFAAFTEAFVEIAEARQ